jgi:hypothetical protein
MRTLLVVSVACLQMACVSYGERANNAGLVLLAAAMFLPLYILTRGGKC